MQRTNVGRPSIMQSLDAIAIAMVTVAVWLCSSSVEILPNKAPLFSPVASSFSTRSLKFETGSIMVPFFGGMLSVGLED